MNIIAEPAINPNLFVRWFAKTGNSYRYFKRPL